MFGFAACGDESGDEAGDGSNNANNASANNSNNANNASMNNSNNATNGSTNNSNNATNGSTNNSNNATNGSTNNSNNASTNNASTNNGTNQSGEFSCTEILQCILGCQPDDTDCPDACQSQGTLQAQQEIDAYLGCVDENCPMDLGISELTECIEMNCSVEQDTCLEL